MGVAPRHRTPPHGAYLPTAIRLAQRDATTALVAALTALAGPGAAAVSLSQAICGAREGGVVHWRLHIAVDLVLPDTPMEVSDAEPPG
ncbi:MAG: hypothetical protein K2X74_18990 [Acetobacteraceae bacterium]|nr:hypothetical protein [Acetobacteraceae bacterium]